MPVRVLIAVMCTCGGVDSGHAYLWGCYTADQGVREGGWGGGAGGGKRVFNI